MKLKATLAAAVIGASAIITPVIVAPTASALPACKRVAGPVCDRTQPVDTSHKPREVRGHLSGKKDVNDGKTAGVLS